MRILIAAAVLASAGPVVHADNWPPQWRGPAGTGVSNERPLPTIVLRAGRTPQVLARNTIDGRILASPALAGGRLFVRTDDRLVAIR